MRRNRLRFVIASTALCVGCLAGNPAAGLPIWFTVSGVSFTPGSGYGMDAAEQSPNNPTLLDVRFSTAGFTNQNFSLDLPSPDASTFLYGTVDLEEPATGGGILASETDNLGVTASLTFTSPLGVSQNLTAIGTATTGPVAGPNVDYTLSWTPVLVNFGSGGQFRIDLANLSFSGTGSQDLRGTVTLLASPTQTPGGSIPEPASLALVGLGLASLALMRRRRRI